MQKQVETMFCDFCGASQHDRKVLIAAPNMAAICEECIPECLAIIQKGNPELLAEIFAKVQAQPTQSAQAGQGA